MLGDQRCEARPVHILLVRLGNRRLYIADLAERLESMDSGRIEMNAVAYRLFARRLAAAVADYPPELLEAQLGRLHPAVMHALEQQRFDAHGVMHGRAGRRAYAVAASLLRRLVRCGP